MQVTVLDMAAIQIHILMEPRCIDKQKIGH